jgi:hypothetical protein
MAIVKAGLRPQTISRVLVALPKEVTNMALLIPWNSHHTVLYLTMELPAHTMVHPVLATGLRAHHHLAPKVARHLNLLMAHLSSYHMDKVINTRAGEPMATRDHLFRNRTLR